jgi:hypothetical protein
MKIFYFLALSILIISSCKNEADEYKNLYTGLIKEREADSLILLKVSLQRIKFDSIFSNIDSLYSLGKNNVKLNKKNFLEKLDQIDLIIKENCIEIEKLNKEIEASKFISSQLTINEFNSKKVKLEQINSELIKALKDEALKTEGENIVLNEKVKDLTVSNYELEMERKRLSREIRKQKRNKVAYKNELEALRKAQKNSEDQITLSYIEAGKNLEDIANNSKKILFFDNMSNSAKNDLADHAFEYYCLAHKRGNIQALTLISALKENKKLGKFVKDKECK